MSESYARLNDDTFNGGKYVRTLTHQIDGQDRHSHTLSLVEPGDGETVSVGALLKEQNELLYMILSELREAAGKPKLAGNFPI